MKWYEKLKAKRLELNKTQADMGALIGVSERTIKRYENGEVDEPLPIVKKSINEKIGRLF